MNSFWLPFSRCFSKCLFVPSGWESRNLSFSCRQNKQTAVPNTLLHQHTHKPRPPGYLPNFLSSFPALSPLSHLPALSSSSQGPLYPSPCHTTAKPGPWGCESAHQPHSSSGLPPSTPKLSRSPPALHGDLPRAPQALRAGHPPLLPVSQPVFS